MAETLRCKSLLNGMGCTRDPTKNYLVDVIGLNSAAGIALVSDQNRKDIIKALTNAIDTAVAEADRINCNITTNHAIEMLVFEVKDLAQSGVVQDIDLLNYLNSVDAVIFYQEVAQEAGEAA